MNNSLLSGLVVILTQTFYRLFCMHTQCTGVGGDWVFDVPVSVSVDVPLLIETDVAYRIKLLSAQLLGSKNTFGATSAPSCYCTVYLVNEKARLTKANNHFEKNKIK